ncbi:MAG: histidine kinase, partial [Rhodanobacteraceae bacterium]|nr:histidine kinase [Rhodanobacteraceae bacterium]
MGPDSTIERGEWLARALMPPLLAGAVLAGIYVSALFDEPPGFSLTMLAVIVTLVYALAEALRWLSRGLQRRWPWQQRFGRRLALQLALSLLLSAALLLALYVPAKLAEIAAGSNDTLEWPHLAFTLLVALAFGGGLALQQLVFDLLAEWRRSERAAEDARRQALRAELDALKAQLNPHFLFNSLNALHALIDQDPPRARELVLELSDVLRYVLREGAQDLVPLAQELDFVRGWLRILAARHGAALDVRIDIDAAPGERLPPLALQLLIENAVRHNRVDPDAPLRLRLVREDGGVRV